MYNHYLKVFICVADAGSFSKAAEQLFVSANAVIKQINSFEEHLGFALFYRNHKGVILTEEGKVIYREGKKMIEHSDDIVQKLRKQKKKQVVRFGSSQLYSIKQIEGIWDLARKECSDLEIKITACSDGNYLDADNDIWKQVDVLCAAFGYCKEDGKLEQLQLGSLNIAWAMPYNHPLAQKKSLRPEDLYGMDLMMVHKVVSSYIDALREEIESKHPRIHIIDVPAYRLETFNRCVNEGKLMVSFQEWGYVHPFIVNVPFERPYQMPYGLLYQKHPNKAVQTFVEAVRKSCCLSEQR